jgi:hypothetical protein
LDAYAHWNSYAMFPALAYRHGGAMITEHNIQYGVGWPLVLVALSSFAPLSYKLELQMAVVWGCIYYSALFFLLQTLLRRTSWAFAGLFLALFLQCFGGMVGARKWWLPSGTVLRYSVDMFFFLACLYHARSGKAWWGLLIGGLAGCAVLFGTDTGIYLSVCFLFYTAAICRLQSRVVGLRATLEFIACAIPAFLATLVTGLAVATRGTMFQATFWSQWFEAVMDFGGGISDLPIAQSLMDWATMFEQPYKDMLVNWCTYFLLAVMVVAYLFSILWMFQRLFFRSATAEDLITGMVGLYGMATFLLYVGRSDAMYLRNVSIPFCIVVMRLLAGCHESFARQLPMMVVPQRLASTSSALAWLPRLVVAATVIALCASPGFLDYPGILQTALGNRWTVRQAPTDNYLFASSRDAPMPEQLRPEVTAFQEVTKAMRQLSENGKYSVAMLSMRDTAYLVEADLRPYFRYSPVLQTLIRKDQVRGIEQVLIDHPPDYVFYPAQSPPSIFGVPPEKDDDIYVPIRKVIQEHFNWESNVCGIDVYRRKSAQGP